MLFTVNVMMAGEIRYIAFVVWVFAIKGDQE